jgi:hypothetical protein
MRQSIKLKKYNLKPMCTHHTVKIIGLLIIVFLISDCTDDKEIKPKAVSQTTVTVANNSLTAVEFETDGVKYKLEAGGEKVFTGKPDQVFAGEAVTFGKTTTGSQVGGKLTWTVDDKFPPTGDRKVNFDVASDYFFLEVINKSEYTITQVIVNFELQSQTVDDVTIENDGETYSIGYYKAFSNSNVRLRTDIGYWHQPTLDLPNEKNQKYTFTAN